MKIKVLHLINSMEPGGAESLLKSFLNNADSKTFEYHLAFFYKTGSFLDGWEPGIQITNFSKTGRFSFLSLFKLYAYMKKNKFQILHTHLVQAGIIGRVFGRFLRIPVIISTRHHEVLLKSGTLLYRLDDYLAKKWNTSTISISASVHKFMLKAGYSADKITLISNGVDCGYFKADNSVKKAAHSIVSAGRLVQEKNFDLLIEAVNLLKTGYENIHCTIIGDGPLFHHLSQKTAALKLQENITLCGAKSGAEVKEIMQQNQLYVSSSAFEGLPVSILEAMALELPVIAPALGSFRNLIQNGESGILVDPDNADQLAASIRSLFEHPETRTKIGKEARHTVEEKYSIKTLAAKTQALYQSLLEQKGLL